MSAEEKTVTYVNIEPEWENTCEWFAHVLIEHGFEQWAYSPVISFMEQVRYLALTDADALERILTRLRNEDARRSH